MRRLLVVALALIVGIWWVTAPRPEIQVAGALTIDPAVEAAVRSVDRSAEFATSLEQFSSSVPAFDDAKSVDLQEYGGPPVTVLLRYADGLAFV